MKCHYCSSQAEEGYHLTGLTLPIPIFVCSECYGKMYEKKKNKKEKSNYSILVNLISLFFFPFGILMYFYWKDTRPQAAKSAFKFALIPIAFYLLVKVLDAIIL